MGEPKTLGDSRSEVFGRYMLYAPIARGGMATVHIARLVGAEGFSRIVAAKKLHEQYTEDQDFVTMFLDEARIASKIHHPNVVPVLDVVLSGSDVVLVQEYVHGVPLDKLMKAVHVRGELIPVPIAVAIAAGVLAGLHAAHEARDEMGEALNIVHRDVSPQNVIISSDGLPRLLDFGIAKAKSSAHVTQEGFFKGKVTYIPPEQLRGEPPARTTDIYAAGVVLWEMLVGRRLHAGRGETELYSAVLSGALPEVAAGLEGRDDIPEERLRVARQLDPVVMRALALAPASRYATAADLAQALVAVVPPATPIEVGAWVRELGADFLETRQRVITATEESWRSLTKMPAGPASSPTTLTSGIKPRHDARETTSDGAPPPTAWKSPRKSPVALGAFLLALVGLFGAWRALQPPPPGTIAVPPVFATRTPSAPAPLPVPTPGGGSPAPAPTPDTPGAPAASQAATAAPSSKPVSAVLALHPANRPPPPPPPPRVAPHPAPPQPAPAPSAAAPVSTCTPPFYFEGTKKVFKPGCL